MILDISLAHAHSEFLMQCNEIWAIVEPHDYAKVSERFRQLLHTEPELAERVHLIWVMHYDEHLPPPIDHGLHLLPKDMRVALIRGSETRLRPGDVARLVHRLQGIHLGLALGGGKALGAFHLGALRAFERADIYFDRIAGTSIGAIVGIAYAAGLTPEQVRDLLLTELTPPKSIRRFRGAQEWYLWAIFRFHRIEAKLRRYLHDYTFEQLYLPVHTVSVDLVSGNEIVRETGDVVRAILESINLPGVAPPIRQDDQVLVDGGILNTVPADVLRKPQLQLCHGHQPAHQAFRGPLLQLFPCLHADHRGSTDPACQLSHLSRRHAHCHRPVALQLR